MVELFGNLRNRRVIDVLRSRFPDVIWKWEHPYWVNSAGWYVYATAELSPTHPEDDDTFRTTYRRSDTRERLYFL